MLRCGVLDDENNSRKAQRRQLYEPASGWQKKKRSDDRFHHKTVARRTRREKSRGLAREITRREDGKSRGLTAGATFQYPARENMVKMSEAEPRKRSRMRSSLVTLLFLVLAVVLIPAALLYFRQHSFIYYPRKYTPGYERVLPAGAVALRYRTVAGDQVAFYIPPRSGAAQPERVWLMFSGNASVALDWLDVVALSRNTRDGFLLIDYPGYGASEGMAAIATTRGSAEQAVTALAEQLQMPEGDLRERLCVLGLSLGAAAALDFAAHVSAQRIILIAPFTSLREVAARLFSKPASYLLLENYDNVARVQELAERQPAPRISIFHGTADTLIPIDMGRDLAEAAPAITEFFPVERATHDTIVGDALPQIIEAMSR